MKQTTRRRAGRGLALAAAVGATLTMTTMGTAQAATPEVFQLCSKGSYGSWAEFPERGGLATAVVPSGKCMSVDLRGKKPEKVEIRTAAGKLIGATTFDARVGLNIATIDTPNGPDFKPF